MITIDNFLQGIGKSHRIYSKRYENKNGEHYLDTARGTEKLAPIHSIIGSDIAKMLTIENKSAYSINAYGIPFSDRLDGVITKNMGAELSLQGKYVEKKCDVSLSKKINIFTPTGRKAAKIEHIPLAGVLSKCVFTNYSQNKDNYFSGLRAETSNLRKLGHPIGQLLIILSKIPYHDKNGNLKRYEYLSRDEIVKYIELYNETLEDMERPNALCFMSVDINEIGDVKKTPIENLPFIFGEDDDYISAYNEMSNYVRFIEEFALSCQQLIK